MSRHDEAFLVEDTEEAPAPAGPTAEEKRARVAAAKRKKEIEDTDRALDHELERLELVQRFEKELNGPEGQQFAIHDATATGEGFFVVKLGALITWKTYWDSKMTEVDACDLVTACIVHPSKEAYLAARNRRMGLDIPLTKLLGRLYGLDIKADEKK